MILIMVLSMKWNKGNKILQFLCYFVRLYNSNDFITEKTKRCQKYWKNIGNKIIKWIGKNWILLWSFLYQKFILNMYRMLYIDDILIGINMIYMISKESSLDCNNDFVTVTLFDTFCDTVSFKWVQLH